MPASGPLSVPAQLTSGLRHLTNRSLHRLVDHSVHLFERVSRPRFEQRVGRAGVRITRDLRYAEGAGRAHLLDVYQPRGAPVPGAPSRATHPVIFYVHGGGFAMLSKDTHRVFALAFARRGYVVVNISYRLGVTHPFPEPLQDAAEALVWAREHVAEYGGDITRLALVGESAGGNLVTALALACASPPLLQPQPLLPPLQVKPRAVIPFYGLLEVANLERLRAKRRMPPHIWSQLQHAAESYLGRDFRTRVAEWANPLTLIEALPAGTALPAFFSICGTKDPLLSDSKRLHAALERIGAQSELVVAPGEIHAYNVLFWRPAAKDAWRRTWAFLGRELPT